MPEPSPSPIQLYNESAVSIPLTADDIVQAVQLVTKEEHCSFNLLEVVYLDEAGIVDINKKHLGRTYVTDTISFRYDDDPSNNQIEGTLFCCAPRIYEQAKELGEKASDEFMRIVIHGLLHLIGYEDRSADDKAEMSRKEDHYLQLFNNE